MHRGGSRKRGFFATAMRGICIVRYYGETSPIQAGQGAVSLYSSLYLFDQLLHPTSHSCIYSAAWLVTSLSFLPRRLSRAINSSTAIPALSEVCRESLSK